MIKQLILCSILSGACGGTVEERVAFPVSIRGVGMADLPNEHGWTVTIEEAHLHVAGVHFYEGEPVFGAREASWSDAMAWVLLAPTPAFAHPGHYTPGAALGEVLTPTTVDLLAADAALVGTSEGVTGGYRSARIDLAAEGGVTASVHGTARTGTTSVAFVADVDTTVKLEGLAFRHDVDARGGTATIEVVLDTWIDRVDFADVQDGATLAPGSRAHNALTRGIEDLAGFRFTWETP